MNITCPKCKVNLELEGSSQEWDGQTVQCPECKVSLRIPKKSIGRKSIKPDSNVNVPSVRSAMSDSLPEKSALDTKRCPYCAEEIKVEAIKCKHCGSDLLERKEQTLKNSETLGVILLCLPICAGFLFWFWINNTSNPVPLLNAVVVFTVLLTSILIAVESNSVGAGSAQDIAPNGKKREGPVAWFFSGILLWALAFPMWMYRRSNYGLKNLCLGAIGALLIFYGGFIFCILPRSVVNTVPSITESTPQTEAFDPVGNFTKGGYKNVVKLDVPPNDILGDMVGLVERNANDNNPDHGILLNGNIIGAIRNTEMELYGVKESIELIISAVMPGETGDPVTIIRTASRMYVFRRLQENAVEGASWLMEVVKNDGSAHQQYFLKGKDVVTTAQAAKTITSQADSSTLELPKVEVRKIDAEAQYNLAVCYYKGDGVEKDPVKALELLMKAAERGNAGAQGGLGIIYASGDGVEKNQVKAIEWYTKAAIQGNAVAQSLLAACYATGDGVAKNKAKAVEWYTKAAERGRPEAQCWLGLFYATGDGVEKNMEKAVEWWTKAAEQGDANAKENLATLRTTENKSYVDDIVARGAKKSPPDKDAAETLLATVADALVNTMIQDGQLIGARRTGIVIQYIKGRQDVDANAIVGYEFTFRTRAGFERVNPKGYIFLYHDPRKQDWFKSRTNIDGSPML
ncbi:MAG: hypothetical protein A2283_15270 [Lentisphaerae bacterium RIFOXYA12_FULL_48_11]|nr:MAG: hypothetical protein A2283_15270 [Lentisphaerae bacterium RIFOXYA12_FULL_48_11]